MTPKHPPMTEPCGDLDCPYPHPGDAVGDLYRTFVVRVHREFAGGFLAGFGIAAATALLLAFIWWPR